MSTLLDRSAKDHALLRERLKDAYGLADDEQTLADTLEGISDFKELCLTALREAKRREAYAEAIKDIIADNRERQSRHELAAERIRAAVAEAMAEAGENKLQTADMTVTLRYPKPKLSIDPERIWDQYRIPVTTFKIDKEAIQAEVDDGNVPDGVTITNPGPAITVRTK